MNPFDHFVKEILRVKYYLRYTDDFVLLHEDRDVLLSLLPRIQEGLKAQLDLDLHPRKVVLTKLSQGIDFLGYVVLPHYTLLRSRTKRRIFKRVEEEGLSENQLSSYLGLLSHCEGYDLEHQLRLAYLNQVSGIGQTDIYRSISTVGLFFVFVC